VGYDGGELRYLFEPELAQGAVHDIADKGGDFLLRRVIDNTPVSYHGIALAHQGFGPGRERAPGTLKRSWRRRLGVRREFRRGSVAMVSEVYTNDPIAPFVENDTRPHVIRPKNPNGFLRFRVWPTGELVFARMVRHPGTTGQHMMLAATNAASIEFHHIARGPVQDWARMAARHAMQRNAGRTGLPVGAA
jgi:hypothetical protein